jgi:CheY-like chemotaxis protein
VKTLLLADDSVTVQRVIELTFADEGMRVVAVGDGRQAIERLATERPDVVLADVSMPECDGYELTAHVKGDPALSHIPVVLMTGAFDHLDEARARQAGCDGVIAKPFEPQMVIALVRRLLAGERGPLVPDRGAGEGSPPSVEIALGHPFDTTDLADASASVDDYFERLDEALSASSARGLPPSSARQSPGRHAPPPPAEGATRDEPGTDPEAGHRSAQGSLPTLGEAFSLLLAEEMGETAPAWPGGVSRPASRVTLDEASLAELARRVGERLTDRVVRDIVASEVLPLAERLVREEIERLKRG